MFFSRQISLWDPSYDLLLYDVIVTFVSQKNHNYASVPSLLSLFFYHQQKFSFQSYRAIPVLFIYFFFEVYRFGCLAILFYGLRFTSGSLCFLGLFSFLFSGEETRRRGIILIYGVLLFFSCLETNSISRDIHIGYLAEMYWEKS